MEYVNYVWFVIGIVVNIIVTVAAVAFALGRMASKVDVVQKDLTEFRAAEEDRWKVCREEILLRRTDYITMNREAKEGFLQYCNQHRSECSMSITKRLDNIEGFMQKLSEFMGDVNRFMKTFNGTGGR